MRNAVGAVDNVLVLGGTSDIGMAIADALVNRGVRRVVLAGRNIAALEAAADAFRDRAETAVRFFDAASTESHAALIAELTEELGDLDVAVLAAGVQPDQAAAEHDPSIAVEAATINYVGAMSISLVLANQMRHQGHGQIVILSSVAAERPRRSNFIYGSTKAGLDAFAEGLGYALNGSGVSVLTVRPGFVRTKLTKGHTEAPFAVEAADVATATVTALDAGRSVVWVPPQVRWIMSGIRHLPRGAVGRIKR